MMLMLGCAGAGARQDRLRTIVILCGILLATSLLAVAPSAAAREVACTDLAQPDCEALVCADTDLDGHLQHDECEPRYCTCDPQPDPW